jgi:hypothetical protein
MTIVLKLEDDMPIGKHKGTKLLHLLEDEPNYLRWFAECCTDRYVLDSIIDDCLVSNDLRWDVLRERRGF